MSESSPTTACFFPEDIVIDILLRLPIKSLLRFRSVCKRWFSLISPQFVRSQLLRPISSAPVKVIFSTKSLKSSLENRIGNRIIDLDCPLITPGNYVQVLGTCNGSICLIVNTKEVFTLNPFNGKFKKLPPPPEPVCFMRKIRWVRGCIDLVGGFGFDSAIDDYKIVFIAPMIVASSPTRVMVLNLRDNIWRITQCLFSDDFFREASGFLLNGKWSGTGSGAFLNGALHWDARSLAGDQDCAETIKVIVYFDLSEEVVKKMVVPVEIKLSGIAVLGGYLCAHSYNQESTEMWLMQEYGVEASWVRLYRIINNAPTRYKWKPVCLLSNGELLLVIHGMIMSFGLRHHKTIGTRIAAWDPSNGDVRDVIIDGHHHLRVAAMDLRSVVPPCDHLV